MARGPKERGPGSDCQQVRVSFGSDAISRLRLIVGLTAQHCGCAKNHWTAGLKHHMDGRERRRGRGLSSGSGSGGKHWPALSCRFTQIPPGMFYSLSEKPPQWAWEQATGLGSLWGCPECPLKRPQAHGMAIETDPSPERRLEGVSRAKASRPPVPGLSQDSLVWGPSPFLWEWLRACRPHQHAWSELCPPVLHVSAHRPPPAGSPSDFPDTSGPCCGPGPCGAPC